MARRIALTVLALVAVLLGAVAVPLGVITAQQFRHDFTDETVSAAASLAGAAEEHLDDHASRAALDRSIGRLDRSGDQVSVYDTSGRRIAGTASQPATPGDVLRLAHSGAGGVSYPTADRMLVLTPVRNDSSTARLGIVILSRSTEPLDHRIAVVWAWLAAVSVAGLIAAAAIATALSRWVGRPLGALEAAAQRLGEGRLDARAPARAGPSEVRRLAVNFNRMAARLETLVDGHQAVIADVSHQLRTPLAALRLRLDVLAQEAPDHVASELGDAQEEVRRLSRMVDGLLAVARAENATTTPVPIPVDAVIIDRVAAWRPAAEEKSVLLTASAGEPVSARLGEGQLEQILDNLLANALDAVPGNGQIRVSAEPAGHRVRVIVADDGPGMTPRQRQTAFRRFVTATPGGTGLGLAIVHRLVTSAGGAAELSDSPGGGLTVTLDLPATPRDRTARRPVPHPAARDLG